MANDIRNRRKAIRLQQNQLATLCSIRKETLSRIENGVDAVPGYVEMILSLIERDEQALRFAMRKAGLLEGVESA